MPRHWTQTKQRVINSEPQDIQGTVIVAGIAGIQSLPNMAPEDFRNEAPGMHERILHDLQMIVVDESKPQRGCV